MSTPPPLPPRRSQKKKSLPEERQRFFGRFGNALLGWEVLRAGRRTGQLALARSVLGGCLLVAMWALWSAQSESLDGMTGSASEISRKLGRFANTFAVTFFIVQAIAVLLLTPVFVAGAIFEERETRSGEILLTTRLTRREVYIGKVGARIVQVLMVVFAGIPILSLTQLWGGVEIEMIIVCYIAVAISAIGAGTITAAVSAYAESMRAAILRSYLMIFLVDGLMFPASPILVIAMSAGGWIAGACSFIWYLPLQVGIVLVSYSIGQRWLRMAMLRQKKRLNEGEREPPPLPGQFRRRLTVLSETDSPLVWKELHATKRVKPSELLQNFFRVSDHVSAADSLENMGFLRWVAISPHGMAFFLRILTLLTSFTIGVMSIFDVISPDLLLGRVGAIVLIWLILAVGLTTSSAVAKERQKHTLIDLFMLPGPRSEILQAKLLGGLAHAILPLGILAIVILLSWIGGGVSMLAFPGLALAAFSFAILSATFGIWLSARCRSIVQSNVLFLGAVFLVVVGTYLAAAAVQETRYTQAGNADRTAETIYPSWSRVVNPMLAWDRLIFRSSMPRAVEFSYRIDEGYVPFTFSTYMMSAASIPLAIVFSVIFWLVAVRQFDREGRI